MNLVHNFISVLFSSPFVLACGLVVVNPVMIAFALHVGELFNVKCYYPRCLQVFAVGLGSNTSQVKHTAIKLVLLHAMLFHE